MNNQYVLRAQLIPLNGATLLLPNTAVAEVVHFNDVEATPSTPSWVYGMINWRGLSLPLLSMEGLLEMDVLPLNKEKRIIVLNSLDNNQDMPFIAIVSDGNPHLIKLHEDTMGDELMEEHSSHYIHTVSVYRDRRVLVPDLNAIKESLQDSLHF